MMKEDVTAAVLQSARGVDLSGKVVVLTGASGRIGRPLARALARRGARLALCARRKEPLTALARTLGPTAVFSVSSCDVSSAEQTRRFIDAVGRRFGGIDVLINNAGARGQKAPLGGDPADWERVLGTNLTGAYLMARAAVPWMRGRSGVIVNVSSGAGRAAEPGWGAYCVSKSGLDGLTRLLGAELSAKGIRAYSLDPGIVRGRPSRLSEALESAFVYLCGGAAREDAAVGYGLVEAAFADPASRSQGFAVMRCRE